MLMKHQNIFKSIKNGSFIYTVLKQFNFNHKIIIPRLFITSSAVRGADGKTLIYMRNNGIFEVPEILKCL